MPIHLINLDRSTERLAEFRRHNSHLEDVERFSAIDGSKEDMASLVRRGLFEPGVPEAYGAGAVGAALSHLALWTRAIERKETLTVCEDDAIFNHGFVAAAERVIADLPSDWDFILWGWNFDAHLLFELLPGVSPCLCCFDEATMRQGIHAFQHRAIAPQSFKLIRALGIPCYSVSAKGARALKAACFPSARIKVHFPGLDRHLPNFGVDVMMNHAFPNLKAFVSFPPLAITPNELKTSTIQAEFHQGAKS
jgi:glycosyl transferase, family 25